MVRVVSMFFWIVSVSCISLKVYAESQLTILEMIDVPKGNVDLYTCPDDARICSEPEFILRNIAVPSFRIGKFEVTMEQWNNGTPVFLMEAVKSLNLTGHIKIVL